MDRLDYIAKQQGRLTVSGEPQGYDAYVVAEASRRRGAPVLFVAADDEQADAAERAIGFFAPQMMVLASFASRAQCTLAPRPSALLTKAFRYRSRCNRTSSLIARASVRNSSQLLKPVAAAKRRSPKRRKPWPPG